VGAISALSGRLRVPAWSPGGEWAGVEQEDSARKAMDPWGTLPKSDMIYERHKTKANVVF
jgi:hypothetical protein